MKFEYNKKGGVRLRDEWKDRSEEALFTFINNCKKVKILTDDSVSCITYVFEDLQSGFISPYVTTRSNDLNAPVKKILFKLGYNNPTAAKSYYIPCNRSSQVELEVVTQSDFNSEVVIQNFLFQESINNFSSILEPICPAIICYTNSVGTIKETIKNLILSKLEDKTRGINNINDIQITQNLFNINNYNMFLIVMEFMDGFTPLSTLGRNRHHRYQQFCDMHAYELQKMSGYGYVHGDFHQGNVMINPDYPYFTADKQNPYYGRALLIDFGRVMEANSTQYRNWALGNNQKKYQWFWQYRQLLGRLSVKLGYGRQNIGEILKNQRIAMNTAFEATVSKNSWLAIMDSIQKQKI